MLLDGRAISSVGASSTLHVMDQCHLLRDLKVLNIELVTYLPFQSQHFSGHIILEKIICSTDQMEGGGSAGGPGPGPVTPVSPQLTAPFPRSWRQRKQFRVSGG